MQKTNRVDEIISTTLSTKNDWKTLAFDLSLLKTDELLSMTSNGADPLVVLDPSAHSLTYSFFITTRCLHNASEDPKKLYMALRNFVELFDPEQLALAPSIFKSVGSALIHIATVLQQPLLPLQDLKTTIERYSPSPVAFTSLHGDFVRACIKAKMYTFPLSLLDNDMETFEVNQSMIEIQHVLEYYYYGAIVYIAHKRWNRALDFLSIVISAPSEKAVSAIQINAYKKYILVSLIDEGHVKPLPKYTASLVERFCQAQSSPYVHLAETFKKTDIQAFQEIATQSRTMFESDKHIGLIKQCFESLRRKKIKELTKVYIAVRLQDMARKIGDTTPQELEQVLVEMINTKEIMACITVDQEHIKTVHFKDTDKDDRKKLEESILNVSVLNSRILLMDKLEALNEDFQSKYMTLSSTGLGMSEQFVEEEMDLPVDDNGTMVGTSSFTAPP
ncbi:hypothetical protein BY458DRAFT_542522 [Sporodiniella umbellata]|nr:hypothetical protein BY458DRAFT_542522 [Sporodiniella umbellata]